MFDKPLIAIVSMAFLSATAHADGRDQAKQQVKAADIEYRLGRFAEALEGYTRAYELYPVAPLLFNIGQCHRALAHHAKAIFFFEGYLRDAPTATNRALVEDLIREARVELDRASATPAEPPVMIGAPPTVAIIAPSQATGPPLASRSAERPLGDDPPSRVWPGLLIGGGAAAMAAGAAFYYYGHKRGPDEKYVYDDTRLLGGAALVAGGAAIVIGAVLWRRAPAAAPVVALAADGGYVGWAAAF
jgi:tetratricopeptide (TPR) repeat protein